MYPVAVQYLQLHRVAAALVHVLTGTGTQNQHAKAVVVGQRAGNAAFLSAGVFHELV